MKNLLLFGRGCSNCKIYFSFNLTNGSQTVVLFAEVLLGKGDNLIIILTRS
jgi:hypothetical protein